MASSSSRRTLTAAAILTFFAASFSLSADESQQSNPSTAPDSAPKILHEAPLENAPLYLLVDGHFPDGGLPFIVDTGCSTGLLVDSRVGPLFGKPMNEVALEGKMVSSYLIPETKAAGLVFPAQETLTCDEDFLREMTGYRVVAAVGWPALKGKTLTLDYDGGHWSVLEGNHPLPEATGTLPLAAGDRPLVGVPLDGEDTTFLIDTGFDGAISLLPAQFDRLKQEGWIEERATGVPTVNVQGVQAVRTGWFVQGTLMGAPLKGLLVTTEVHAPQSLLGLEFFMKFNLAFSNEPSQMSFKLRENPPPPIDTQLMLGIVPTFLHGQMVVARIKQDGAAQRAGVEVQDQILSIEELNGEVMNIGTITHLCEKQVGKKLTLHLKHKDQDQEQKVEMQLPAFISSWDTRAAVEGN